MFTIEQIEEANSKVENDADFSNWNPQNLFEKYLPFRAAQENNG